MKSIPTDATFQLSNKTSSRIFYSQLALSLLIILGCFIFQYTFSYDYAEDSGFEALHCALLPIAVDLTLLAVTCSAMWKSVTNRSALKPKVFAYVLLFTQFGIAFGHAYSLEPADPTAVHSFSIWIVSFDTQQLMAMAIPAIMFITIELTINSTQQYISDLSSQQKHHLESELHEEKRRGEDLQLTLSSNAEKIEALKHENAGLQVKNTDLSETLQSLKEHKKRPGRPPSKKTAKKKAAATSAKPSQVKNSQPSRASQEQKGLSDSFQNNQTMSAKPNSPNSKNAQSEQSNAPSKTQTN